MRRFFVALAASAVSVFVVVNVASAGNWEKFDNPVPTTVVVRVLSHGAKSMSPNTGALVVIRDAATNAVLDKGDVQGSTGDTTALMNTGYARVTGQTGLVDGQKGVLLKGADECETHTSDTESAKFVGSVKISRPTQVVVEAHGPMMPHHAGATAVTTTWLFPGEDVVGEGIVLVLRGLIVDCLASLKESELDVDTVKDGISVPFYMRMMCGCPIAPKSAGLPWEAEGFRVTTQAYYRGGLYHEETTTSDKLFVDVSRFVTRVPLPPEMPDGPFRREQLKIRVMASQPGLANFGLDEFSVFLNR